MAQDYDHDPVRFLIETYHELNPAVVDELPAQPGALQFMRYVAKNRPWIVRKGAKDWKAVRRWDARYLREVMSKKSVNVAITPKGNADALVEDEHGRLIFVEPYERSETFDEFLDYVQEDSTFSKSDLAGRNVKYAQTQNDNLRDEYSALFADVPSSIDFATEALELEPDAVNFWLGNERSVTSLHKDNYENVYVQVRGQKHFTLLPPIEIACVNESHVPFARYQPPSEHDLQLTPKIYADRDPIPVPLWDPTQPDVRASAYSDCSQAMSVTLNEGDMMYLPALWYHRVAQGNGEEGFSCSINYWYDMEFSGGFWAQNAFVRDVVVAKKKEVNYPGFHDGIRTHQTST